MEVKKVVLMAGVLIGLLVVTRSSLSVGHNIEPYDAARDRTELEYMLTHDPYWRKNMPVDVHKVLAYQCSDPDLPQFHGNLHIFVARTQEKLIGTVAYYTLNQKGVIYLLHVEPAFRRQGYGRQLVHFVIDTLASEGIQHVIVRTGRSNQASSKLYKQLGFKPFKEDDQYRYFEKVS